MRNDSYRGLPWLFVVMVLLAFHGLFLSCNNAQSRAKKIISLKNDRQELIDTLYAEYGGSPIAKTVQERSQQAPAGQEGERNAIMEVVGAFATNVDRSLFEETLRAVGQGEAGVYFSEKTRIFFSSDAVRKKARKVCEMDIEISLLEKAQLENL